MTTEVETEGVARWRLGREIPPGAILTAVSMGAAAVMVALQIFAGWTNQTRDGLELRKEITSLELRLKEADGRLVERSNERLASVNSRFEGMAARLDNLERKQDSGDQRVTRLEERIVSIADGVAWIRQKLDTSRR